MSMKLSRINYRDIFSLEVEEVISAGGQQAIRHWIARTGQFCTCSSCFPSWWDWHWEANQQDQGGNTRKTVIHGAEQEVPIVYRGRLSNRLAQYIKFRTGRNLTPEQKSELGNLLVQYRPRPSTYWFDFTKHFNWHDGDFGDEGSCFWGPNREAKPLLEDAGAYAIRFYNPDCAPYGTKQDARGLGIGRAWIVPVRQYISGKERNWRVLFNGYWTYAHDDDTTHKIALIFAKFLNAQWRKVSLSNMGTCTGLIYINGGRGFLMSSREDLPYAPECVDLQIPDDDSYSECDSCGEILNDENTFFSPDNAPLCQDCFNEYVYTCPWCERDVWRDEARLVDETLICIDCYYRNTAICSDCGERHITIEPSYYHYISAVTFYTLFDGESICQDCYRSGEYGHCAICHEIYPVDDLNEDGHCNDCATELKGEKSHAAH